LSAVSPPYRLQRLLSEWGARLDRLGLQTLFYGQTLRSTGDAVLRYRTELLRLIAEMGFGAGALAMIGGTVVIVGFLTVSVGALVAVIGFNQLSQIGIEALTGWSLDDPELAKQLSAEYTPATWHNHPAEVVESFFGGLELAGPGLTEAQTWRPWLTEPVPCHRDGHVLAGVARLGDA